MKGCTVKPQIVGWAFFDINGVCVPVIDKSW